MIENDHFWDPGHVFGQHLTQYQVHQNIIKLQFTQIPVSNDNICKALIWTSNGIQKVQYKKNQIKIKYKIWKQNLW